MSLRMPGIERAERFVEQQDARLHHQRLRDGEPLLHAARKLVRILVERSGEADALEHRDALRRVRARRRAPNSRPVNSRCGSSSPSSTLRSTLRCGNTE